MKDRGVYAVEKTVYSVEGVALRSIELDESVFGRSVNRGVIYYAINSELSNKRLGTACTKGRSEVHGSNTKPYKQKGTGRARRGDKKSPLLVGGGTIFGPKPRDFHYALPKKVKRLAMKSLLSLKAQGDALTVIEDFTVESGKTRDLIQVLRHFAQKERTVFILQNDDALLKRAGRNIPTLSFLSYNRLRAHDLFYGRKVLVLETAVHKIADFYRSKDAAQDGTY